MEINNHKSSQPVEFPGGEKTNLDRWGWGSIGINLLLSLLNLSIAYFSGSLAVVSEMIHNLVDLMSSVAVLLGLKISRRHSKAFPYGLYKVENVISVALALLIFFTGYEIAREAVLGSQQIKVISLWMFGGVTLSALIPLLFSYFELRAGKSANSPSLIASATEYRTHVFTSGVVLFSLITHSFGLNLDRFAALVVVFFIAKSGWGLLRDGMRVLLDASLDPETLAQVRKIIESDPATDQINNLTGRNSGKYRFLEAEITLRVDDLKKAHDASQRIEQAIKAEVPFIERVLIHYEPAVPTFKSYAFPLNSSAGILSDHFGEAPYFGVIKRRLSDGSIEKHELIRNPYQAEVKSKGIQVAEWLVSQKVDCIVLKENIQGKGPEIVLSNAGVELLYTRADTLTAAIQEFHLEG